MVLFLGRALVPEAYLYSRLLPSAQMWWIGGLSKVALLGIALVLIARTLPRFTAGTTSRRAWTLLLGGLAGFWIGQAYILGYQLVRSVSVVFPSPAEIFFVAAYPLLIAALFAFLKAYDESGLPVGQPSERRRIGWITTGLCLLVAYPLLAPTLKAPVPALEKSLNTLYPLLDFALLVPAVLLFRTALRFRGGAIARIWIAILSGVFLLCWGDVLFAYFTAWDLPWLDPALDAIFIACYGCIALGVTYLYEEMRG